MSFAAVSRAENLPDQRVDLAYAFYDAGGDQISGPALSVTRHIGRSYSLSGLYETDRVKASDVDLAAPFAMRLNETRQVGRLDFDVRDGATEYSVGASRTWGPSAETSQIRATISQSFFHDLTTLTVGAAKGWDSVYRVLADGQARDPNYKGKADRRSWWFNLDQIVTPRWRLTYEGGLLDQSGALGNPNLAARFSLADGLIVTTAEVTPGTRSRYNSSLHAKYDMEHRGTLAFGAGYYYDSWGVRARAYDASWLRAYRHERLLLDLHARRYSQGSAKFYMDLGAGLPTGDISRDRALATHDSLAVGGGLTWQTRWRPHLGIKHWSTGLNVDFVRYRYKDFRDVTVAGASAGAEPLYQANGYLAQIHLTGSF
jgi:hypothetical protein